MDRSLRKMLRQSLIVRAPGTMDGAGERTYGSQILLMGFITTKSTYYLPQFIRNAEGEQFIPRMLIIVEGNGQGVTDHWVINLPDGRTVSIVTALPLYDDNGKLDHTEIYV